MGWATNDQLVFIDWDDSLKKVDEVTARFIDLGGDVVSEISLDLPYPWHTFSLSQWVGAVSPDGGEVVLQAAQEENGVNELHRFDLQTGLRTAEAVSIGIDRVCGLGWAGNDPTVPTHDGGPDWENGTTHVLDGEVLRPLTVVEPRLGTDCFVWAEDALAGGPRDGVLDLSTGWWTWWWRELSAGLILSAALGWAVWRWRQALGARGPRAHSASSQAGESESW